MRINSYTRLLGFANTAMGKLVAVVVAVAMTFSLTTIAHAVDGAIEALTNGASTDAVSLDAVADETQATVSVSAENCHVLINGQTVQGSVTLPAHAGFSFQVQPEEGYLLFSVSVEDALGALPFDGGDGTYAIEGDFVEGALSIAAVATLDVDNPPEDNPVVPIIDDTVIDDGKTVPEPLYGAPTIVLDDVTKQYDGATLDSVPYAVEGLEEGDELFVTQFDGSLTDVGSTDISVASYTIWRGDQNVTAYYEPAVVDAGRLVVEPATLRVFTPSATKAYDGEPLVYRGDVNEGDEAMVETLWGDDQVEFEVVGSQTNAGSSPNRYELSWVSGNPENYELVEEVGTLTVLPAEEAVYVIAPSASKTYDGKPIDAGAITWTGLPDDYKVEARYEGGTTDVAVVVTSIVEDSVRILDPDENDVTENYTVETIDGEAVVEPAMLSVFTESAFKDADGTPLTAAGAIGGFVNGETATFTVTGSQSGVGSSVNGYRIDWDGTANQANYQIHEELGTLEIYEEVIEKVDAKPITGQPNVISGGSQGSQGVGQAAAPAAQAAPSASAPQVVVEEPAVETVQEIIEYVVVETVEPYSAPAATTVPSANTAPSSGSNAATAPESSAAAASSAASAASESPDAASSAQQDQSSEGIDPTVESIATGMQNLEQVISGEEPTPLAAPATEEGAQEEVLADEETPLGVFDEPVDCWVHWYIVLGLIATLIYGAVVMFFRRAYAYELEMREAAVLGTGEGVAPEQVPASSGGKAGKEA